MQGQHARPTSSLFGPAPIAQTTQPDKTSAKHSRRVRITTRLRRRLLAYRAIEFLSTHIPGTAHPDEECLLLVHIRHVVGEVHYRFRPDCAHGVITSVVIDERFHSAGLGIRALSHLRSRHPGTVWRSTTTLRTARGLLRRTQIPTITSDMSCCSSVKAIA